MTGLEMAKYPNAYLEASLNQRYLYFRFNRVNGHYY